MSGKIYICNVEGLRPEEIRRLLDGTQPDYTGAMGTNAKVMAGQLGLSPEFTYGVIDKCILKALIGKSSLIMTSGGMVDHALHRIEAYCSESGAVIEAVRMASFSQINPEMKKRALEAAR
jgi:cobalt/nickel transport system ATP-binding protein